jgi:hypothetical protein
MKLEIPIPGAAAPKLANRSPFLQLVAARARSLKLRIVFTAPQRPSGNTRRATLAALREAELAEWQATGGDYLASAHQAVR